jgi:hypothetical protein
MRYTTIVLFVSILSLSGCAGNSQIIKTEQNATPEEVAKIQIKPNLDLPPPINLDKYKLDESKVKQYKEGEDVYIALPEKDMQNQQEFLLILKTRILELQKIIINAKKLM